MRTDRTIDPVIDLDDTPEEISVGTKHQVDVDADDDKILPPRCEKNTDGSVTVTFDYPVSVTVKSGGQERSENYASLTFHRLRGVDLSAMRSTAPEHQSLVLLSRSSRVPHRIMSVLYGKMDAADISRCDKVLSSFL